jgi:hypothetical protein
MVWFYDFYNRGLRRIFEFCLKMHFLQLRDLRLIQCRLWCHIRTITKCACFQMVGYDGITVN